MAKKLVVAGSCVAAAGGCVGVGAIIMTSLSSDDSGSDAAEDNRDVQQEQQGPGAGTDAPPDPSAQQTTQEIKTEEQQEPKVTEPVKEGNDQADVPSSSSEETSDQIPESVDSNDNASEEEEDNDGLNDQHSDVTYAITGNYPKLKESCDNLSVNWKNLFHFLATDNENWEDHMTDLKKAQDSKKDQYVTIDKALTAPSGSYNDKTWTDLISEYNQWLQNWEKQIQSSNDEKEQWMTLRDKDLETFQKQNRFQNLFKELT